MCWAGRDLASAEGQAALRAVAALQRTHCHLWAPALQQEDHLPQGNPDPRVHPKILHPGFGSRAPLTPGMKVKVRRTAGKSSRPLCDVVIHADHHFFLSSACQDCCLEPGKADCKVRLVPAFMTEGAGRLSWVRSGRWGHAQVAYAITATSSAATSWLLEKHDGLSFTWGCGGVHLPELSFSARVLCPASLLSPVNSQISSSRSALLRPHVTSLSWT